MKYCVEWDFREVYDTKAEALRRGAALIKFYKGVVKIYDGHGKFVKSFDGRKRNV